MKKSELRQMIKEVLKEELSKRPLKEAICNCTKCGADCDDLTSNAFGEKLCDDCWDDFIDSERGLVDAYELIASGDLDVLELSSNPEVKEAEISNAWNKYRKDLVYSKKKLAEIETNYEDIITEYLFGEGFID